MSTQERLTALYQKMLDHFGAQNWWPADTPFEMMVGAILTQNTNWKNVERAIQSLHEHQVMNLEDMAAMPVDLLAAAIRSAGYYNMKAQRLHNLCACVLRYGDGTVEGFLDQDQDTLRERLLRVKGIGPETADSIVLYAGGKPSFVVDTYTHRILSRHELIPLESTYHEIQEVFMDNLPAEAELYGEFHALLVQVAKEYCKKTTPLCSSCPLQEGGDWQPYIEM